MTRERVRERADELPVAGHAAWRSVGIMRQARLAQAVHVVEKDVMPRSFDVERHRTLGSGSALTRWSRARRLVQRCPSPHC